MEGSHSDIVGTRGRIETISGQITRVTVEYRADGCVTWREEER